MQPSTVYDIIGIGIGPFNLGLAALSGNIPELNCLFIDQNESFNWHPGLLLEGSRLQVPFYADLVTLADPRSPYSYLAFLKSKGRLFRFGISENYFVTRKEYNDYCRWVTEQLPSLRFGLRCLAVRFNPGKGCYKIYVRETRSGLTFLFHGKRLVIGTGTVPHVPSIVQALDHPFVFHSADYLYKKDRLLTKKNIALVGSGQSAAEIFYDLLSHTNGPDSLRWFTRSSRFYPMDYSKLTLEMTSPDYVDHFFSLAPRQKKRILAHQDPLYKGINFGLIGDISDRLYDLSLKDTKTSIGLYPNCTIKKVSVNPDETLHLQFYHSETRRKINREADALILATGYHYQIPSFLEPIKELIGWTPEGLYQVTRNYSIDQYNTLFVQNADLHTHGFNSADLGMGPYRNAIILNTILGYEHFQMEKNVVFQTFGPPEM